MHYDLTTRHGRYRARKAGRNVPKLKPGPRQPDFWSQIDKSRPCWLWTGTLNGDGYGRWGDKKAHRIAYELEHKLQIPPGLVVMHTCDTPACCNPAHLALGTHSDNQKDKTSKDRQAKGECVGGRKLSADQVREIRSKYEKGGHTYLTLAEEYGMSRDLIQKVVRRILWRSV